MNKTVVVGGGGGGIASALLARLRNEEVTLVEAHENLGGCASWFDRGDFCFDVGATTLSGVAPHEPMGKLFHLLKARPEINIQDPGILFHLSTGKKLSYFKEFEKWMGELEREFPDLNHRPFWKKIYSINEKSWTLLSQLNSFPFQSLTDVVELFKAPDLFHLYPYLLVNTEMMLKFYGLWQKDYLELINGILLISAQAHADRVPFLVGAMALAYPCETYAPVGGMKGLFRFFEQQCEERNITVLKNEPVHKIGKTLVETRHQTLPFNKIILNVPYWNIPGLFQKQEQQIISHNFKESKHAWGAFTLYLGVRAQIQELYQQIHLQHPDVPNYFVSFSVPNDLSRAPQGWQAVTISTHVEVGEWLGLSREEYKARKNDFMQLILQDFKNRFGITETKYVTAGTPKTFERYTGRQSGYVGGLPFLYGMNPWSIPGHTTQLQNIYRVGDTTFPGQGLVGVVAGSLALDQQITAKLSHR